MERLRELLLKKEWTWQDFGEAWELAQKMEWWEEFHKSIFAYCYEDCFSHEEVYTGINEQFIHPGHFRDALVEFLEGRK